MGREWWSVGRWGEGQWGEGQTLRGTGARDRHSGGEGQTLRAHFFLRDGTNHLTLRCSGPAYRLEVGVPRRWGQARMALS